MSSSVAFDATNTTSGAGRIENKASSAEGSEVVDEVWPAEFALAERLRDCCTIFGKEREDALSTTADILLDMGDLYLTKVKASKGMLQKLTLLRCSALLNGAKIRYEITKNKEGMEEANKNLVKLGAEAMRYANTNCCSANLVTISETTFEMAKTMRKNNKSFLEGIPRFENAQEDEPLAESRRRKSEYIRRINESITDEYSSIMAQISRECIDLLGPPPCKFASVGLGSMARKEITPYSDFEHVILLEDGVQNSDDYFDVKEYFRWYAVFFQLIVINFGETFIRSVGVKSLNDLYSEDRQKNWFYDVYTPCGISFDGMVPHSCNNPLGRQEPTKLRAHVVELIQPVSEMAQLVNRENKLKNGYYVNEILTRTCFVNGDEDIFATFYHQVGISIKAEHLNHMAEAQFDAMRFNCNPNVQTMRPYGGTYFNMKEKMYRPITVLLSCLARLNKIIHPSSFEIIDILEKNGTISDAFADEIRFALALACEYRARHYSEGESQRYQMEVKSMIKSIGLGSYQHFCLVLEKLRRASRYSVAAALRNRTSIMWTELSQYADDFNHNIAIANCLYQTGLYDEAIDIAEQFIENESLINQAEFLNTFLFSYLAKNKDAQTEFTDTKRCLKHLDLIESLPNVVEELKVLVLPLKVIILARTGRQIKAIELCDTSIKRIDVLSSKPSFVLGTRRQMEDWKAVLLIGLKEYNRALKHCKTILTGNLADYMKTRWTLVMQKVEAQFRVGKSDEALTELRQIKEVIRGKGKELFTEEFSIEIIYQIMRCEFDNGRYLDVITTSRLLDFLVREPDVRFEHSYMHYVKNTGLFLTTAYIKLNRFKECIHASNELIDISKRINAQKPIQKVEIKKETYQRLALAHSHLGTDKTLTPNLGERITHMREAAKIFQKYPKDDGIIPFYRPVLASLVWSLYRLPSRDTLSDDARCKEIMNLMENAPSVIRRSKRMQPPAIAFSLKMVAMIANNVQTSNSLQTSRGLLRNLRWAFQYQTTHPVVFLSLMKVMQQHRKNSDPIVTIEIDDLESSFNSRYQYLRKKVGNRGAEAVEMYGRFDLVHAVPKLWLLLNENPKREILPDVVNLLLSAVVFVLNRPGKSIGFLNDCIGLL